MKLRHSGPRPLEVWLGHKSWVFGNGKDESREGCHAVMVELRIEHEAGHCYVGAGSVLEIFIHTHTQRTGM